MRPSLPRPASRSLGLTLLATAVLPLALAGCGDDPTLRFADYAHYQRDNVTTRSVPAQSDLASRLAADGWRLEHQDGAAPALRTTHDRARIWFFSARGDATGAELHRRILDPDASERQALAYRLNNGKRMVVAWPSSAEIQRLPLRRGRVRAGWNALDLFVRRPGPGRERGSLELRGFRILDGLEDQVRDDGPRTLEIENGELAMPGESYLELAFEVAAGSRLQGRARSDAARSSGDPHQVTLRLLDQEGVEHQLSDFALAPGASERLDLDLAAWAGQVVDLRISVGGPRGSSVRWREAGVVGSSDRRAVEASIRPAATARSGRLGRPDVFIIVLDAARADAFGTYGAEHPTPAVDSLAAAGTRFERAISPSSWTGQSIPALLAGFHPDTLHAERWGDSLPAEVPHVAELMAAAGYRTVLWSQHPIYNRAASLVRGFEHVRYSGRRKRTLFPARSFLLERERPTFALIHLLPPHSPYSPPAPFRGAYSSGYRGKLPPKLGALGRIGKKRMLKLTAADHGYIFDRYLENVAFADWLVGRVMDNLRKSRRYEEALVIITSDHGEAFFEHGRFMHSRELYQEFIRIPLIVKWPRGRTGFAPSIQDPASLIDLVPTLVDALDLSGGERGFQGRSLLPAAFDGVPIERPIYAATRGIGDVNRIAMPRWLLEDGGWRVIHDPVAASTELYAVASDPAEADDLAAKHPTVARLLLQRLLIQRWFNLNLLELGPRTESELDPELVEELKALGYL